MPLNNTERMFWRRQNTICIFLYPDAIWRMYYSMVLKMTHNCFQLVYLPGFKSEKSYYAYRWKCYESHFLTVAVKHMNKYIYIYMNKSQQTVVLLWVCFWFIFYDVQSALQQTSVRTTAGFPAGPVGVKPEVSLILLGRRVREELHTDTMTNRCSLDHRVISGLSVTELDTPSWSLFGIQPDQSWAHPSALWGDMLYKWKKYGTVILKENTNFTHEGCY